MNNIYVTDLSAINYLLRGGKLKVLAQTGTVVIQPRIISEGVDGDYSDLQTEYVDRGVVAYDFYSEEEMAELYEFYCELRENVDGLSFYDIPPIYTAKKRKCPLLTGDDILLNKARGIADVVMCSVKDFCRDLQEQLIDRHHVLVTVTIYGAGEESYIQEV